MPVARRIETERLVLRRPEPEDAGACFEVHGDPRTSRFIPHGQDLSLEKSRHRLDGWIAHWARHGFGPWAVEERGAGILGFGGLRWRGEDEIPGLPLALNLYFRLRPSAWGRGLATELARAAVEFAFGSLDAKEVTAITTSENAASIGVLERLGMERAAEIAYRDAPSLFWTLRRPPSFER